jgi:hypothetical protein
LEYSPKKTIPKRIKNVEIPVYRPEFNLRWELCNQMKDVDPDVNFYSIRPLSHEFINFIDGEKTVEEIAKAVGYEYGIRIIGDHVLLLFLHLEEIGLITLHQKE